MARNLSDYGQTRKLNSAEQANQVQYQDQTRAQSLLQNNASAASSTDAQQAATMGATNQFTNVAAPTGGIQQNALKRLTDSGMTVQSATDKLGAQQPKIQQAFNQVGTGSANRTTAGNERYQTRLQEIEKSGQEAIANERAAGFSGGQAMAQLDKAKAQAQSDFEQEQQQEQEVKDTTLDKQTNGSEGQPAPMNEQQAGAAAAFGNLPPEAQFLAPFLQDFQSTMQGALSSNQNMTNALLNGGEVNGTQVKGINQTFDGIDKRLEDMESNYVNTSQALQGMLETVKQQNEKHLSEQEKAQEDRLMWTKVKQQRELSRQKTAAHESMVAQIALAGGFGQDAGLAAVRESDAMYESKMSEVEVELGIQRTELAAKFSGLYLQNQNEYVKDSVTNMKDLLSGLERIGLQKNSNEQARGAAEQSLVQNAWKNETDLRMKKSEKNIELVNMVSDLMAEDRTSKAQAQKELWDNAMNYVDRYGTQNPEALGEYERALGLPTGALSDQKTLEELRMKKSGSGGVGSSGASAIVDEERSRILKLYPSATGEMVDKLVYSSLVARFGSSEKGKSVTMAAYDYMAGNPVNGESYRIQPFLTSSQGTKLIDDTLQSLEDQRALEAGEVEISDLYSQLIENEWTDEQAIEYIEGLGYIHAPSAFKFRGSEFSKY
jgi:hypothetical protein